MSSHSQSQEPPSSPITNQPLSEESTILKPRLSPSTFRPPPIQRKETCHEFVKRAVDHVLQRGSFELIMFHISNATVSEMLAIFLPSHDGTTNPFLEWALDKATWIHHEFTHSKLVTVEHMVGRALIHSALLSVYEHGPYAYSDNTRDRRLVYEKRGNFAQYCWPEDYLCHLLSLSSAPHWSKSPAGSPKAKVIEDRVKADKVDFDHIPCVRGERCSRRSPSRRRSRSPSRQRGHRSAPTRHRQTQNVHSSRHRSRSRTRQRSRSHQVKADRNRGHRSPPPRR